MRSVSSLTSHLPPFDHPNNIWWSVHITNLLQCICKMKKQPFSLHKKRIFKKPQTVKLPDCAIGVPVPLVHWPLNVTVSSALPISPLSRQQSPESKPVYLSRDLLKQRQPVAILREMLPFFRWGRALLELNGIWLVSFHCRLHKTTSVYQWHMSATLESSGKLGHIRGVYTWH
jgi:hypothetical protein